PVLKRLIEASHSVIGCSSNRQRAPLPILHHRVWSERCGKHALSENVFCRWPGQIKEKALQPDCRNVALFKRATNPPPICGRSENISVMADQITPAGHTGSCIIRPRFPPGEVSFRIW